MEGERRGSYNAKQRRNVQASAKLQLPTAKGLATRKAGRGHATPHVPVEMTKC